MLKFVKKSEIFGALDAGLHTELGWSAAATHLKTWQDIAIYQRIKDFEGKSIAEIGGGRSRVLKRLKERNVCFNIDKFEGANGGPKEEVSIEDVVNVKAFLGEFSSDIQDNAFDLVYSVSVVEHVPNEGLAAFMDDTLRVLKPNGLCLHAIDLYVGTHEVPEAQRRLDIYRRCMDRPGLIPLEVDLVDRAIFRSDYVSNPDLTMWTWGKTAPALRAKRELTQSVTLLMGFQKG